MVLKAQLPSATKYNVQPGDLLDIYSEQKAISKEQAWAGPFKVVKIFYRQVRVQVQNLERQYSLDHVLPVACERKVKARLSSLHTNDEYSTTNTTCIYLTGYLNPSDPRENITAFDKMKIHDVAFLKQNKVFEVVNKDEVTNWQTSWGRFVMCVKEPGTCHERHKAKFVVHGHRDKEKKKLVHTSNRTCKIVLSGR